MSKKDWGRSSDPPQTPLHSVQASSGRTHELPIRIYFGDTDAGGVVYHSNYLTLAERARVEAMRDSGVPHTEMMTEHGCMFMVRRVNVEYLRPARLDDLVTVVTQAIASTAATITLSQIVRLGSVDLVRLEVGLVCVSVSSQKPVRIPQRFRAGMMA
jgi:acyl-CoA thioester hydrolase